MSRFLNTDKFKVGVNYECRDDVQLSTDDVQLSIDDVQLSTGANKASL